jgi:hypothetical protein
MLSDIWSIILNLIASFLWSGIVWLWQNRNRRTVSPPTPVLPTTERAEPIDRRARNRQALASKAHQFFFYLATFMVLYLSVTIPPLSKALLAKEQVLLSNARFIGEYLPAIPVGKDYLQLTFFLVSAFLYGPLLFFANGVTSLLYPLLDSFHPVTFRIWSVVTMLTFFVFCIPVAATSIWLFFIISFKDSLLIVLFAQFFFFAMGQSQSSRE